MKNFAYAVATAACLTVGAVPTVQAQMPFVGVATNYDRVSGYRAYARADICRTVTVRKHMRNGNVLIRRIHRCR